MDPITIAMIIAAGAQGASLISENVNARKQAKLAGEHGDEMSDYFEQLALESDATGRAYGQTEAGKYLSGVAEEGLYSDTEELALMSQISRATAQSSETAQADYMGMLAAQGLEGSVVGARGVGDIESQRMQTISDAQTDLSLSEAEYSAQAGSQYAQQATEWEQMYSQMADKYQQAGMEAQYAGSMQELQMLNQATSEFTSGIMQSATSLGTGYMNYDMYKTQSDLLEDAIKNNNYELISALLSGNN